MVSGETLRGAVFTALVVLLLLPGMGSSEAQQSLTFIDLTAAISAAGFNPSGAAFGIDCGTVIDQFVYVTVDDSGLDPGQGPDGAQGLVGEIDKDSLDAQIFANPDLELFRQLGILQRFYSITRDPDTGNLFVNERDNGKLWRFNPITAGNGLDSIPGTVDDTGWTAIPLIEQLTQDIVPETDPNGQPLVDPYFEYGVKGSITFEDGYNRAPNIVRAHTNSIGDGDLVISTGGDGTVVFANGFIWVGLTYFIGDEFTIADGIPPVTFTGVAKVDPIAVQVVDRIPIPSATQVTGLAVDSEDSNILWVTDLFGSMVFKFDTTKPPVEAVIEEIPLEPDSFPRGIDTDANNIFVALNKDPDGNSEILQINKADTSQQTTIDTTASNDGGGTFSVFVNNDLLVWTDLSRHVGIINISTTPPTIDSVLETETFTNHFGCVPKDGEFWFAGRGSSKVGILPNSKFSVGVGVGRARPTGSGGGGTGMFRGRGYAFGDPNSANYDSIAPIIEEPMIMAGSMKVIAQISDNVGVKEANLILGKDAYPMKRWDGSQNVWLGILPSSVLPGLGTSIELKLVAKDYSNNIAELPYSAEVPIGASSTASSEGASFAVTPLALLGQQADPSYSILASGVRPDDPNTNPLITIKNTSNEPLKNLRLVLSPELKGKFLLSDNAIKSIAPNSEATVLLKLNGNPNVDVMKEPIPYDGQIIVMIDNHSPLVLKLKGNIPNESSSLQSLFMKMIGNKAEQRYKTFEKPDERIAQDAEYQVTLGSGESVIKSASDELIITNNGDKPLKNLRIFTSSIADHFLPDQKNIALVPAGSFIKVKLVSNLNDAESRDLSGELLVVPENGAPVAIPIDIGRKLADDKNALYEVRTLSGNDAISNTADGVMIRNNSEDAIENIRIILPRELARVLSISEDSFKSIEPNTEKIVYLQPRGPLDSRVKQILNDYTGQTIIVSSDGMKKVIPVDIVWKGISSEHLLIHARDNTEELTKATQVINSLERSYSEVAGMIDEANTKTVIYMTSSLDELKMLSDTLAPSTYVYDEDVAFVWSNSEDVNMLALKEFAYRTIMQNYASYWTKQKISADKGNWLVDGVSHYVATRIVGERGMIKQQLDAFIAEPASFEWYGAATPSQYGATYTLFKFLAGKYGDSIIDKALGYLGSTMASNHRCDTLEQCALLYAVYDLSGLDMDNKRYTLNFKNLVDEWHEHVEDNHSWG